MAELTEQEREALADWWLNGEEGTLYAAVEAILAARESGLRARVEALAEGWQHTPDHYCCEKCALRAVLDDEAPERSRDDG